MNKTISVCSLCVVVSFYFCNSPSQTVNPNDKDISAEFTSGALGCGNFIVYKSNAVQSKWIVIEASLDPLALSTEFRTFHIDSSLHDYNIHYDYYPVNKDSTVQSNFMYCNDIVFANDKMPEVWSAIDGSIEIKRSDIDTSGFIHPYAVTVKLLNVHLIDSLKTDTLFIRHMQFDSVQVGWLPG
jgi:hypothetical protein